MDCPSGTLLFKTDKGESIVEICNTQPVLLVFLRHFGCLFCKEALLDIAERREKYSEAGIRIIFVHMSDPELAEKYFNDYGLSGIDHVSDVAKELYNDFGLTRGKVSQLWGLQNLIRGAQLVSNPKIPFTLKTIGDGYQMPGVFVLYKSQILESFVHQMVSDRPEYDAMVSKFLK